MPITLEKRVCRKGASQNSIYGLEYRMVAVPKAAAERLKELKEQTGRPITELVTLAIADFLQTVTVK